MNWLLFTLWYYFDKLYTLFSVSTKRPLWANIGLFSEKVDLARPLRFMSNRVKGKNNDVIDEKRFVNFLPLMQIVRNKEYNHSLTLLLRNMSTRIQNTLWKALITSSLGTQSSAGFLGFLKETISLSSRTFLFSIQIFRKLRWHYNLLCKGRKSTIVWPQK